MSRSTKHILSFLFFKFFLHFQMLLYHPSIRDFVRWIDINGRRSFIHWSRAKVTRAIAYLIDRGTTEIFEDIQPFIWNDNISEHLLSIYCYIFIIYILLIWFINILTPPHLTREKVISSHQQLNMEVYYPLPVIVIQNKKIPDNVVVVPHLLK